MRFGVKAKDEPVGGGRSGGGGFIKYFGKGETKVRFLEELDDWTVFYDHFDKGRGRSFPCLMDDRDNCPGCNSENKMTQRASKRYLVNVLNPETGYVDLYKVPVSCMSDLRRYADKDGGSITERFYTIVQYRDNDDQVKYSVDREEKDKTPVSRYSEQLRDHNDALEAAYYEVWGDEPDEDSPIGDAVPAKKGKAKVAADDAPPFDEDDDEEDIVVKESELMRMDAKQLKTLFIKAGLEPPKTKDPEKLRTRLMDELMPS